MSFRVYLNVTHQGNEVFNEQVLGNNDCFSIEALKRMGINHDEDEPYVDSFTGVIDMTVFWEEFKKHCASQITDCLKAQTLEEHIEYFSDIHSMFYSIPSWSYIGQFPCFVTAYNTSLEGIDKSELVCTLSGG